MNADEQHNEPKSSYFNLPALDVSIAFPQATPASIFPPCTLAGSEAQKQKYLRSLAQLKTIGSWGLTEPGYGSDASSLKTTVTKVLLGITLLELDILDTFGQKHSGGEGSIPASTSDNSTAAAYKDPQISTHGL